jgi:hypothetical protein
LGVRSRPRRIGRRTLPALAIALAALAGLGVPRAAAQESDSIRIETLERQVAGLQAQLDSLRGAAPDAERLDELRRQIDAISRQIESLQLGQDVVEARDGRFGLGPAASKVYQVERGVSIGGYGEMLYRNYSKTRQDGSASGEKDQLDFLRGVFYVGYKFNDRILFNSEIELEHAATSNSGSVSLEFAYLDFFFTSWLGARGGLVLIPMGFLNELHEPPIYLGTERPETERLIIPTTWRENGVGVFGETGGFAFRGFVVNSFDAVGGGTSNAKGFNAEGLRDGRQKGSKAVIENVAGVARLDYVGQRGATIGLSAFYGNTGQGNTDPAGQVIAAPTFIGEVHAEYRSRGWWLRGLYTLSTVGDVPQLNAARNLTGAESIGERLTGWYLEAGYDVLRSVATTHQLIPYLRYEQLNTQDQVPAGFSANPANDQTITTVGAMWKPIANISVKADYQIRTNGARTGVDRLNLNLGYLF